MAENKTGQNLQAGAGLLAKRVQKSLNRAQEKVLQKLGKTMETRDEQFELCAYNLNKQQADGNRLFKDVKAYFSAVKNVHEASKRLSQTLRDIYETDWNGVEDLTVITESEDLLWNDFEEKIRDQIVRTMENYTGQFPDVKERVSKRGRKLVDYDSARHHLEALQSAKKKDEAKISKADEEFNKAQIVFEEINNELREELPVLYQSRIGCYVTVFQNISNLRDTFYKEMSVLNRELYNLMKKLETQHSGKHFIIKGLSSSTSCKSKKRKSVVISSPIPCNTAFPADHVSIHSSIENGKDSNEKTQSIPKAASDLDLTSSGANSPKTRSVSENQTSSEIHPEENLTSSEISQSPEGEQSQESSDSEKEVEEELLSNHSDDVGVGESKSEDVTQELFNSSEAADGKTTKGLDQYSLGSLPSEVVMAEPAAPASPISSSADGCPLSRAQMQSDESFHLEIAESGGDPTYQDPSWPLHKGTALESHEASEEESLKPEPGDPILELTDTQSAEPSRGNTRF